jgi:hypothetical protein
VVYNDREEAIGLLRDAIATRGFKKAECGLLVEITYPSPLPYDKHKRNTEHPPVSGTVPAAAAGGFRGPETVD